ncbi:hypothetical protein G6032_11695 [Wenzhouxiangella sp. XN24]|nr:hypothetical protein [Wenzhouxiangella sp. XN24]
MRPRFGFQRIHVMRRREGWELNKKRVLRLYRLERLQLRMQRAAQVHTCLHRVRSIMDNSAKQKIQPFDLRPKMASLWRFRGG